MPAITLSQEPIPNGGAVFRMPPLLGGLNTSTHPLDIELNEATLCENVSFYNRQIEPDFGIKQVERGTLTDFLSNLSDERILNLYSLQLRDGSKFDIVATATTTSPWKVKFSATNSSVSYTYNLSQEFTGDVYLEYIIWADRIIVGMVGQEAPACISASSWRAADSGEIADSGLGDLYGSESSDLAATFSAEGVVSWNGFILFWNTDEGGTRHPQRIRWADRASATNWTSQNSGYVDLLDGIDDIVALVPLREFLICYRRHSIIRIEYKGVVNDLFSFQTSINVDGPVAIQQIASARHWHFFVGDNGIYRYNGGLDVASITDRIRFIFYNKANQERIHNSCLVFLHSLDKLIWQLEDSPDVYPYTLYMLQVDNVNSTAWTTRTLHKTGRNLPQKPLITEYWHGDIYTWRDGTSNWVDTEHTWDNAPFLATWEYYLEGDSPQRHVGLIHKDDCTLFQYGPAAGELEQFEWRWQSGGLYLNTGYNWEITGITLDGNRDYIRYGSIEWRLKSVGFLTSRRGRIEESGFSSFDITGAGVDSGWTQLCASQRVDVRCPDFEPFVIQIRGKRSREGRNFGYRHHIIFGVSIHLRPKDGLGKRG